MNGMILYFGRYGSTRQYAAWLAQSTGFELINLALSPKLDFAAANPLVLGSAVFRGRLLIADWLAANWDELRSKKVVLFTVSGLSEPALEQVLSSSLTPEMRLRIQIFSLQGRFAPAQGTWAERLGFWLPGWSPSLKDSFAQLQREPLQPVLAHIRELTRWQNRVTALAFRTRRAGGRLASVWTQGSRGLPFGSNG